MNIKLNSDDLIFIKDQIKNYESLRLPYTTTNFESSVRSIFAKDYSRILYSSSIRRLQGKMQFLTISSNNFYRNRLTHSHEVIQIARTLAGAIKRELKDVSIYNDDMYVIESSCLAHDIGNPPFGHAGESVLNNLMQSFGGYEGNAQTLRILNKLERRFPNTYGLLLSKRTILSVVKYFNKGNSHEKFLYEDDFEIVDQISSENCVNVRTLDTQIMDLSDEIAYAAHDLEDSLRLKLFNIQDLLFEFKNNEKYKSAYDIFKSIIDLSHEVAYKSNAKSSEDYNYFFIKEITSRIVDTLVQDIGIVEIDEGFIKKTGTQNKKELGFINHSKLSEGLKKLTFKCILRNTDIINYEQQGATIIKDLFELFTDSSYNRDLKLLPAEYRQLHSDAGDSKERVVTDYIAGMMDNYAFELHKKYFGYKALYVK